jgi:uncharacterized protein YjcR
MTKKETENKQELARVLYLNGEKQKTIAERVGVTPVTINRWVNEKGWAEIRAAKNITRPELVNKLLLTINKLIDQVSDSDDSGAMASLGDKLSKLASVIEKLDKKASVVDAIEVFMAFSKWLQYRQSIDKEVTPELIKAINKYQDIYISETINREGK